MTDIEKSIYPASEKKQKKHRFKFLTFLSGLINFALSIGVVACVVYIISVWYPQWAGSGLAAVITGFFFIPFLMAFFAVGILGGIFYLIMGILLLVSSFKEDKKFVRWKGLLITTIVFDFILALFSGLLCLSDIGDAKTIFIAILIATLASAFFKILDMILHKQRIKHNKIEKVVEVQSVNSASPSHINFSALNSSPNNKVKEDNATKKINSIDEIDVADINREE